MADALYIVKVEALTDAVTWALSLPASGSYQVYAKWTADETRATDARYSIVHGGGTAEVTVNQRVGGGLWHYLGSYAFDPLSNPTVTLAANDNGSVAADAIRFVGGPGGATDVAYLHTDHLGTPQAMTDANAQVLWWRDQTPFGQTVSEGGFSASPLRFPGQIADAESGLAYNYFRDYDPALGRYIQSDPIGLRGGLNTFGYVMGNPLRYFDPHGLEAGVIIWEPAGWGESSFGHASAYVDENSYSYGPGGMSKMPLDEYIDRNAFREGFGHGLNLTKEEEEEFEKCLLEPQGEYSWFSNSCTDPIERCLAKVGHDIGDSLTPMGMGQSILSEPNLTTTDRHYRQSQPTTGTKAPWAK